MTLIVVLLLILGYLLIATGHLTGVNKSAIAVFIGTAGWVVYICWGTDFVMAEHPADYADYLVGQTPSSQAVKHFIHNQIFIHYVGRAASIVLFLLATMTIVEILTGNGCFDFITEWVSTPKTSRLLPAITLATFLLSANLSNLTTATMMLIVTRALVHSRRQRMLVGSAVVLAANCGGCFTVIGDPTSLLLWGDGAVTPTAFSSALALPSLVACAVPVALIARQLPARLDTVPTAPPYRGDDTNLNRWQRLVMLFVGIGGLWFIPTFHNLTKLTPFLGALCVLSVLWVVNEAFNRKLNASDQKTGRLVPRATQYGAIQQILFVTGIMLAMGVMTETGVFGDISAWIDDTFHSVWVTGLLAALLSSLVDTFTVAATCISLYPVATPDSLACGPAADYAASFAPNGAYWQVISYATAVGGTLLSVGSVSGLALMQMEHVRLGWYLKNITPKILVGFICGLIVLWAEHTLL